MNETAMSDALALAKKNPVFVATADASGTPHLACAGSLSGGEDGTVRVTEWFCPATVENVRRNPRISLTVWDEPADRGYQLVGEVEELEELGVLDGYAAEVETDGPVPQVQRRLVVRVDRILDFSRAPHTDVEE